MGRHAAPRCPSCALLLEVCPPAWLPLPPPLSPSRQDNLLWDRLSAREHLTFYGRLKVRCWRLSGLHSCFHLAWLRVLACSARSSPHWAGRFRLRASSPGSPLAPHPALPQNLRGEQLKAAVDDALRSVNLFHGGVGDKQVGMPPLCL